MSKSQHRALTTSDKTWIGEPASYAVVIASIDEGKNRKAQGYRVDIIFIIIIITLIF